MKIPKSVIDLMLPEILSPLLYCEQMRPRVLLALLDAQRDTTTLFVDIQNHHLYFVAQVDDLGGVYVLVSPIHFRNVYQTFNTLFQLGKQP